MGVSYARNHCRGVIFMGKLQLSVDHAQSTRATYRREDPGGRGFGDFLYTCSCMRWVAYMTMSSCFVLHIRSSDPLTLIDLACGKPLGSHSQA